MRHPTKPLEPQDRALGMELVSDELFDLTFYQALLPYSTGSVRRILEELVPVETRHLAFWREFFGIPEAGLDWGRRAKLRILVALCRLFGSNAMQLSLEAIEIYGIRKYLWVWKRYKDDPLGKAVREILKDEFEHEDAIVAGASSPTLRPEDVRSIVMGLNDGLVEILGAVSGFFAAFHEPRLVLMAGSSVAVAGALSMAAGAFGAASSEAEVEDLERVKAHFLGNEGTLEPSSGPVRAALLVGTAYFLGALIPLLPVVLGARNLLAPWLAAGAVSVVVSFVLAFLSGMQVRRRAATNLALMALAVAVTYAIGALARGVWGISV